MAFMPRDSGKLIARLAKNVFIEEEGIKNLACEVLEGLKNRTISINNFSQSELHPNPGHANAVDWIFVLDTLNFSFWPNHGDNKWEVNGHTGYFALCSAIKRAIDEGIPITDPNYYVNITSDDLGRILRPDTAAGVAPLLEERVKNLQQVGKVLLEKFNGTFVECIKASQYSAEKLLKLIVSNFECYQDEGDFHGHRVSFYKRAQILIGDIWSCYKGSDLGEFNDVEVITMFADYRVPQVLLHFGAMRYSNPLLSTLQTGSQESVDKIPEDQIVKTSTSSPTIILEDIFDYIKEHEKLNPNHVEIGNLLEKLEILRKKNDKLNERVDEIEIRTAHLTENLESFVKDLNNAVIRLEALEENLNNTGAYYDGRLAELEERIQDIRDGIPYCFNTSRGFTIFHERLLQVEAQNLSKEIVIFGLPEIQGENLEELVSSIFSILKTEISQNDVVIVERMGKKEENSQRFRAVRLCLVSEFKVNWLLDAMKSKSHFHADEISPILPMSKIFLKRRPPSALPLLRRKILEQWDQLRPQDVWLGRTAVFVRFRRNEEPIKIHYEGDFHLLS